MSVSVSDFWKLAVESRLLTPAECQKLGQEFGRVKGAATQGNARTLAEWLSAQETLTRYQCKVLLAGQSGPFFYGDYRVQARVAKGRLAGMFRAVHVPTRHPVMLQFLAGEVAEDPQKWTAAAIHGQAHARVSHENLQGVYELVDLVRFKFAAVEDLQGESAADRLSTAGKLPSAEACRVVRSAAQALAPLHQAGLAHGDIRPQNLWLSSDGHVKLIRDPFTRPAPLSVSGGNDARADYAAPELAQSGAAPTPLTDIYALGCTLVHLMTGRPPFAGGDAAAKMQRHASEPLPALEPHGVPKAASQITAFLMAKNPQVRYQQASLVAEALAPYLTPAARSAAPASPPPTLAAYQEFVAKRNAALSGASSSGQAPSASPSGNGSNGSAAAATGAASPLAGSGSARTASSPAAAMAAVATPVAAPTGSPAATATPAAATSSGQSLSQVAQLATASRGPKLDTLAAKRPNTRRTDEPDEARDRKQTIIMAGSAAAVVLLVLGIVIAMNGSGGDDSDRVADKPAAKKNEDKPSPRRSTPRSRSGTKRGSQSGDTSPVSTGPKYAVYNDDEESLFAPPTSGPPISFKYVPRGTQMMIALRPAAMLESPEGQKAWRALGPNFQELWTRWSSAAGIEAAGIRQVIFAFYPNQNQTPRVAAVVWPSSALPDYNRWGSLTEKQSGDQKYYQSGNGWSYYVPQQSGDRVFVMAAESEIQTVIQAHGSAGWMRGTFRKLADMSDADRHVTVIFQPYFVYNKMLDVFTGPLRPVLWPVKKFIGPVAEVDAGMLSLHFGSNFFAEMRIQGKGIGSPDRMAQEYATRTGEMVRELATYMYDVPRQPYWDDLRKRFAEMVRTAASDRFTRFGSEHSQVVMTSMLPGHAAHNLIAGAELTIYSAGGSSSAGPVTTKKAPATAQEALGQTISLAFPRKSLEFAMKEFSEEIQFPVKIIGKHLQLDGITRNQQINDFDQRNKKAADILLAMVMKANPVPNITDPTVDDQKLVYVIAPDPANPGSKPIILITTRNAAKTNGYTLQDVFAK